MVFEVINPESIIENKIHKIIRNFEIGMHHIIPARKYRFLIDKKPQKTCYIILFTNPSARAGYDTREFFKRSLTGLNSELSFS